MRCSHWQWATAITSRRGDRSKLCIVRSWDWPSSSLPVLRLLDFHNLEWFFFPSHWHDLELFWKSHVHNYSTARVVLYVVLQWRNRPPAGRSPARAFAGRAPPPERNRIEKRTPYSFRQHPSPPPSSLPTLSAACTVVVSPFSAFGTRIARIEA